MLPASVLVAFPLSALSCVQPNQSKLCFDSGASPNISSNPFLDFEVVWIISNISGVGNTKEAVTAESEVK